MTKRRLGCERVYLPLCEVADTPFRIQEDELWEIFFVINENSFRLVSVCYSEGFFNAISLVIDVFVSKVVYFKR